MLVAHVSDSCENEITGQVRNRTERLAPRWWFGVPGRKKSNKSSDSDGRVLPFPLSNFQVERNQVMVVWNGDHATQRV